MSCVLIMLVVTVILAMAAVIIEPVTFFLVFLSMRMLTAI